MASIRDLILNVIERKEGSALTAAANDLDKLGRGMDATDDKTKQFTKDTEKLNAEIEKSTARIKDLHKQFAATGDEGLFGDIRKEETRLRNLEKTLKALTPEAEKIANDLHDAGKDAGRGFLNGLTSQFEGFAGTPVLGPALAGLIIGAVVSLGPILLSELGGLVAAAVGTVGVVGGVVASIKDPRVKSALAQFGQDIQDKFFATGASFVDPVRKSLAILERDFDQLNLAGAFAKAAPDLQIIVQGLGQLAKNIMPGFNTALERSGPYAKAAADGFADLGTAISYFLNRVTQTKGSLEGLKTLFAFVSGLVVGIADLIYHAGQAFDWFVRQNEKFFNAAAGVYDFFGKHDIADKFRQVANTMHNLQDESLGTAENIQGLGNSFFGAANQAEYLNKYLAEQLGLEEDLISRSLALDDANLAVAQGWLDLAEKLQRGKGNWSENTQAGIDNLNMIERQIAALDRARQADIAKSDGSVDAINKINAKYDEQLAKLLAIAAQAGDSKKHLEELAKTYYIDVIYSVFEREAAKQANRLDKYFPSYDSGGMVPGPVGAPQLAVVHGGERVLTPGQQASAAGGPTVVLQFNPSGSGLFDAFMAEFARFVQVSGGGNVQLAITGRTA